MKSQSKSNLERSVFLTLLFICFVGTTFGQLRSVSVDSMDVGLGGNSAIEGNVILPSGQRLDRRIRVRLFTSTRGDMTSMTDDYGKFSFRGLTGGDYTIVIDGEKEFEPVSQQVNIIQLRGSPPSIYPMNIRLKLKPNTELKAGVVNAELANIPQPALEFYNKAIEFAKTGDHKKAIEQLEFAVSEYPKFMHAYNEMGAQYVQLNKYEEADTAFQSALKIDPEAFLPLRNRGIVLVCLNKFSEAEKVLKSALKINDQSAIGHFYLGKAIANQNRFDEAEKEFLAAAKIGGDTANEAHRFLAIIYSSRGDKKRQISELETYLRLVPKAPDADQLQSLIKKLKG